MLGIVGGSGIYRLIEAPDEEVVDLDTPYGRPSAPVQVGTLGASRVAFLPRHGHGHRFSPSNLPYRANIYALKALGVTEIVALSAVGSLRETLPPRSLVVPDQVIDRTLRRPRTFFDGNVVAHVGLADPYCRSLRDRIVTAAGGAGVSVTDGGTYVCIEGPQFSTRAESNLYRSWGAAVIGMTTMPEARLAREAELCYATLAMVTDYDVWHETEADVSVEVVLGHLQANAEAAAAILRRIAGLPPTTAACGCRDALAAAIITSPEAIDEEERRRLGVIGQRYLAAPFPNE